MRPELFVVLSGCLTFCVPLILAVRELIIVRRDKPGGDWRPRPAPEVSPKPLPPCLTVPLGPSGRINVPKQHRELEPA